MTIGVIKRPILSKLATRYNISQVGSSLHLGDTLIPTINADDLVKSLKQTSTTGTATARTDVYTVPAGKVWIPVAASFLNNSYGDQWIRISLDGGTTLTSLKYVAGASSTDLFWEAGVVIRLTEGHQFRMQRDTGTSNPITTTFLYLEEDQVM